ncbi:MAG: 1,6-anhydro-N-acetylmuramyl-L-alanine amidase AmpD [Limnohabitans sp.]|nr:1,6-anhydro-N-acetylmuramyl-L-alanine amidase AmpD [Limnohabitans sp.]
MVIHTTWQNGWYRFAHHLHSPNFNARPTNTAIDMVVIHSISLPPGQYGSHQVESFFLSQLDHSAHPYFNNLKDTKVSSHFYIKRGGELIQFVSCDERAWHAGESSFKERTQCNNFSIGIELEGLEGNAFEEPQYETLSSLCSSLTLKYPIQHFVGHQDIAPQRKKDPGEKFNWKLFQQSCGCPEKYFLNRFD